MSDIDWIELGHELDSRSKALVASGHTISAEAEPKDGFEEVRLFHNLERALLDGEGEWKEEIPKPEKIKWDWVFEPFIHELFEQNVALWACLGFFQGRRSNPTRRWRYLFSNDLSYENPTDEERKFENFCRALQAFTFNANYPAIAGDAILPTSKFLENLAADNSENKQYPHGATLFASLRNGSRLLDDLEKARADEEHYLDKRTLLADWGDLYKTAHNEETERLDELDRMLPARAIRGFLRREFEKGSWGEVPLGLPAESSIGAAEKYANALKATYEEGIHTAADLLKDNSSDRHHGLRLESFFEKHPEQNEKLTQYVAWIHDVACGETGALVTIPAWFPGAASGGRSGALILGLKKDTQLTPDDFAGLTAAFRMGSTGVALEDQKEKGKEEEERDRAHRKPQLIDTMIRKIKRSGGDIPPEAYVLQNHAAMQLGPNHKITWPAYWEHYQGRGDLASTIEEVWSDIAAGVAWSRISSEGAEIVTDNYQDVAHPALSVDVQDFSELAKQDFVSIISLCCPLLIEACHHSYLHSILEHHKSGSDPKPTVRVSSVGDSSLRITNPYHEPIDLHRASFREKDTQRRGIRRIEENLERSWTVEYESDKESLTPGEDNWKVVIKRRESE